MTQHMIGVNPILDASTTASLIAWWRDAGVDTLVEESPRHWLKKQEAATFAPSAEPASLPDSMAALVEWLQTSPDVPGAGPAARRLAPIGLPGAPIMVMVDMPEQGDVESGRLLSGPAGILFDNMLAALHLDRDSIYLVPLCPGRPSSGQIDADYLPRLAEIGRKMIALAAPKRVWLLGQTTSRALLGADVVAARGKLQFINHDGGNVEVVASLHPRLLLQNPARKAGVWADMKLLAKGMAE